MSLVVCQLHGAYRPTTLHSGCPVCTSTQQINVLSGGSGGVGKPYPTTEETYPADKPTGVKHDQEKPDMSLIPPTAALEEAYVWTFGKKKYSAYNWANGIKYSRILSAIERHLTLLKSGITLDPETKRHHAAAIRCGAAMLIHFDLAGKNDLDDRMPLTPALKAKIEKMAGGEYIWDLL